MRILLFTLEYPPFKGGVANYYNAIVKNWPKPEEIFVLNNNNSILLKNWLWPKWLPAFWQLWHTIKKQKINHVLVGHILPLGTVTYFITKLAKTPYSIILHGMDFTYSLRQPRKKRITKKILENADNIICGNTYTARLVKDFLGEEYKSKAIVVNPGIDPSKTQHNEELITKLKERYKLHDKMALFSIGRLVKRKGFDMVIEALPAVLTKMPNLVYVIAGTGPDEGYLKECLRNLQQNAQKKVIFLGKISDEEKWAWLNLADIFIMPAREEEGDFEGFGIVYLEANLASKPVIAGDSGGVSDAVEDHVNGILVDPESSDAVADGILELAMDKRLRNSLGQQGWRRAVEKFNWEGQIRKIHYLITHNT